MDEVGDDDDSECFEATDEKDEDGSDLNNGQSTPDSTTQLLRKKKQLVPSSPTLTDKQTAVIFKERWKVTSLTKKFTY